MHILIATLDALHIDSDSVVLNRSTLQELRQECRHYESGAIKAEFIENVKFFNLFNLV